MQRIESKKGVAIRLEDDGTYTLEAGSSVSATLGKSASDSVKSLRSSLVGLDGKTTADHNFASLSALASFVRGAQTNGKAFFADDLKGASAPAAQPKQPKQKPAQPASQPKAATAKPSTPTTLSKAQMDANNQIAQGLIRLCDGFGFAIDPRTINTLKYADDPAAFIVKAMELEGFDETLTKDAAKQCTNGEAVELFKAAKAAPSMSGRINRRLEVFYGPAGTGKTTLALSENPNAKVMAGSAGLDPDDLFTIIDPATKTWAKTDLALAMERGEPIIIDEINLYNAVVLQRLQAVTDNKSAIVDRGIELPIADGFKIVATMNLETNMGKTPLPDPLVSRCARIERIDKPYLGWVF